ncbi:MAG: hypothetical protein D6812_02325 [Deltaproteobacteria bacterium]|nr:MAG: hypothetical protein D6812_02325 [Deltaproteobacteria bacterium]
MSFEPATPAGGVIPPQAILTIPIVIDFQTFVAHVEEGAAILTKTAQHLTYEDLAFLNSQMVAPQANVSKRAAQPFYPRLHLFFHLGLGARLFQKIEWKPGRYRLRGTKRLQHFRRLNPIEQYFALLATFVVEVDIEAFFESTGFTAPFVLAHALLELSSMQPGKREPVARWKGGHTLFSLGVEPVLHLLEAFGLLTTAHAVVGRKGKERSEITAFTPSPLGVVIAGILARQRNLFHWNHHLRKRREELLEMLPMMLATMEGDAEVEEVDLIDLMDIEASGPEAGVSFLEPFLPLLPAGSLHRTLPPFAPRRSLAGLFHFTVARSPQARHRITLPGHATLHDLHLAIQREFGLGGGEHLYAFFMTGEAWREPAYYSPDVVDAESTTDVRIGDLGLKGGHKFLYLFDFRRNIRVGVRFDGFEATPPGKEGR